MPRQARFNSEYMHVITRGIGKQILFEDDFDRQKYLFFLKKYGEETGTGIVCYCLMENHVHLLLRSENQSIPVFMKKIGVAYAQFYNRKYERIGHLFQDRYKSEAILSEEYFVTVFKYILNNPAKAGICSAKDYKWSSYGEYGKTGGITDSAILKKLVGGKRQLNSFLNAETNNDDGMEYFPVKRDDEWAKTVMCKTLGIKSGNDIQKYDRLKRDEAIVLLKKKGLSIRQIERLTGINRGVVQKAKVVKENRPQ